MEEYWFSEESIKFLKDVKEKNSKTWFNENKEGFNELLYYPFQRLVGELSGTMLEIDREMEVRPLIDKSISRIYRDTRFSKDKSLYKDRMWFTFKKHGVSKMDYPAYFLELSPDMYRYGMGFFCASPKTMDSYREAINKNEKKFLDMVNDIEKQGHMIPSGEMYKKTKYSGKYQELAQWYDRKNLYLVRNLNNLESIYSKDIIEQIKNDFKEISLLYKFICEALI